MNLPGKLLLGVAIIVFAGCASPPPRHVPPVAGKVAVCHKGNKTVYVDEPAVKAHLGHGDYLGVCR